MYSKISILLLLAFMSISSMAQTVRNNYPNFQSPKRETRAVWLTTFANLDWPKTYATSPENIERQKQELITLLDQYQQANINTVLLQTRVRAATIYPSAIEPWDKCITGKEGKAPSYGYDPLKFVVDECHKRGMAIHAWIASMPAGSKRSLGARMLVQKGFKLRYLSTGAYLNPADSQVPNYLAQICGEVVRNYDVDGIHLDYIRYPDGWSSPTGRYGDTRDDRRVQITNIVRAIHNQVKAIKPWVKMSCSPIGKYADLNHYSSKNYNGRDRLSQESQEWLRQGLMDQLYPMQYFRGTNYYPFLADWEENKHAKEIVSGIGTYFLDPREGNWKLNEVKRQMNVSRDLGIGHAHFRSAFLTNNKQGILDFEQQFNAYPALPQALESKQQTVAAPSYCKDNDLIMSEDSNTKQLAWEGISPYYNIYASKTFPVDITKAENMVYAKFSGKMLTLKNPYQQHNIHYAITAIDRFDNESIALQERSRTTASAHSAMLSNDGITLELPCKMVAFKARYYTVETLQGNIVRQLSGTPKGNTVSIIGLPNGMYKLKAMYPHSKFASNIGFFFVNN